MIKAITIVATTTEFSSSEIYKTKESKNDKVFGEFSESVKINF